MDLIIYAELYLGFDKQSQLEETLAEAGVRRLALPYHAAWPAARAFAAYRRQGGRRSAHLPDSFIGAHALVEGLRGRSIAARIADPGLGLHVSHLADVEVAQALRRYVREGQLDSSSAAAALEDLRSLDLERHSHEPLLERVWALRDNLTA